MSPRFTLLPVLYLTLSLLASPAASAEEPLWVELPAAAKARSIAGTVAAETFASLAEKLSPAVVLISVSLPQSAGSPLRKSSKYLDGGTGFVIRADGYILTNNHVVVDADSIRVRTEANQEYDATLVGAFARADLALLKVEADKPLTAAPLGDSDELRIAEWVLAIGSPFGLNNSVTAGIVSAKGRRDIVPSDGPVHADFIQTDASINPGNSGGPLINMRGEVIGINSAIYRSAQGIGFAIPVNLAKKLLPQLAKGGVEQAFLGVVAQDISPRDAQALGLAAAAGALVAHVVPNSPAQTAGFEVGDVIVRFGGDAVTDSRDLRWVAAIAGVGSKTSVEVLRKGIRKVFSVTLTALPRQVTQQAADSTNAPGLEIPTLGLHVQELTPEERKALGLPAKLGIRVAAVANSGPAATAGLLPGDLILRFGYPAVQSTKAFARMVDNAGPDKPILLHVQRGESGAWVNLRKR